MAAAFKIRRQESFDNGFGQFDAGHAGAQAENVGVVVPAGKLCVQFRRAEGGADALVMVGGHGHADARAAEQDARAVFFFHGQGDVVGDVRIVAAVGGVRAVIRDGQAAFFKLTDDDVFEFQGGVVTADMDVLSHGVLLLRVKVCADKS